METEGCLAAMDSCWFQYVPTDLNSWRPSETRVRRETTAASLIFILNFSYPGNASRRWRRNYTSVNQSLVLFVTQATAMQAKAMNQTLILIVCTDP